MFAAANSNFDLYQDSLEKLSALETEVHLCEHYGALTGAEGRGFMAQSMADAVTMRLLIEEIYNSTRDEEKTIEQLLAKVSENASGYFLPREVMALVLGQMTRFIAKQHKANRKIRIEESGL